MKKETKKIPTLIGIIVLGVGVLLGGFLIKNQRLFFLKAASQYAPSQVRITNLSDTSFTVSWITQVATKGFVSYGETAQLGQTAVDENEKGSTIPIHYVSVKNLKPSTKYYFRINSGGKVFGDGPKPYEVSTGSTINLPLPEADTAYGLVSEAEGSPAKGVIVYLSLANTSPLSSITGSDGSWAIPLSMARNITLSSYSSYDKEFQVEEIFVQGGKLGTCTAIVTTKNDSPVPPLVLGQTYDFRQTGPTRNPTPTTGLRLTTPSPSVSPTSSPLSAGISLEILNPTEGEILNTRRPEFIGTGPASKILEIVLESPAPLSSQVLVDAKGNWQWSAASELSPGAHKITVSYKDEKGNTQKVLRNFSIAVSGSLDLPAFTATEPSRIVTTPTPIPKPPPPGSLTMTITFFTIGLVLIILGFSQFLWINR